MTVYFANGDDVFIPRGVMNQVRDGCFIIVDHSQGSARTYHIPIHSVLYIIS